MPQEKSSSNASSSPLGESIPSSPAPSPLIQNNQPTSQSTNGLAIASIVSTFFIPLVGFILGIIALHQIKQKPQAGKGLAIAAIILSSLYLLLVAVGIVLILVFATFSGVQSKADDTERESDIKSIHAQVEAYYARSGYYPSLANLNDPTFRASNLKGLDPEALRTPGGSNALLVAFPARDSYSYEASPIGCGAVENLCTTYYLTAVLDDDSVYTKASLFDMPPSSDGLQVEDMPFPGEEDAGVPELDLQSTVFE